MLCNDAAAKQKKTELSHIMERIPPYAALTYLRMVRREHATLELKQPFHHRKRIRVPSNRIVHRGKVVHGRACLSNQ
jgi:hypothetical protein